MSVTERAIHLGVAMSALVACGWVFGLHPSAPRIKTPAATSARELTHSTVPALSLIPSGSAFVLTAEVRQLRHAPLGELLSLRLGRAGATADLVKQCGLDPLARLDQLALAVPSAGSAAQEHPEDFGIIAQGRFSAVEILRCASSVITQRGGEAIETQLGKFRSVRDRKQSAEIAATDGTLIVSGGSYFRELLDAAEGHASTKPDPRDARHAELRRTLGAGTVVATWLLDPHWFDRIAGDDRDARLSSLSALTAFGARIDVSDSAHVLLLLDCTDRDGAERILTLLVQMRGSLHALPLDPALSSLAKRVSVSQNGARLTLAVEPTEAELNALLGLLLGP